ncbi:MAG: hypothetical protein CVT92_11360 [Bacteroidetes bacterium HGW-Bacteroidetes-1]|jgi:hypothetical protein|nr:MAG: hypothetical protein CVT92_11360 [Bacteroidetes bacterium HGW-Bacteroidetes-1]
MIEIKSISFRKIEILFVFILLVLLSAGLYYSHIQRFPSHFHAWTQSDRLALAVGFVDNGLNPFLPATNNLHPKYPPSKPLISEKGITSVDFPLIEYLTALVMKIYGGNVPFVFRVIVLLIGLMGLLFLFALFRSVGASFYLSLLSTLFVFSAPVYTYYLNGFIPSIPALSFTFIALYYYSRYLFEKSFISYFLAMGFFVLAALIRMPFIMPMIAVAIVQFAFGFGNKKRHLNEFLIASAGWLFFGVSQLYKSYLGENFGSLFISNLMPATNLKNFLDLMLISWNNWKLDYFSYAHYVLLISSIILITIYWKKLMKSVVLLRLSMVAILCMGAAKVYLYAMAQQFPAHDYYFLDSFFVPVVLIAGIGMALPKAHTKIQNIPLVIGMVFFGLIMIQSTAKVQTERYVTHPWDRVEMSRINFEGSNLLLENNAILPDARMLVLDAYTSNVPLLLMERKGYTVINTSKEEIEESLSWNFDYIAIQNRTLASDVLRNYPQLTEILKPVANNGRIGIYSFDHENEKKSFYRLIGSPKNILLATDFDSLNSCLKPQDEFYPLVDTIIQIDSLAERAIVFKSDATNTGKHPKGLHFVMDISSADGQKYYDSFPLDSFFENKSNTVILLVFLNIPAQNQSNKRIKCYIWNPGKNQICMTNTSVYLTQYSITSKN